MSQNMTVKETADYLSVHPQTLYRMIAYKKIPFFRLTEKGSIRFKRQSLDKWMASKTVVMKKQYV